MSASAPPVLLGTVALEPNRWSTIDPSGAATLELTDLLDAIVDVGFDGLELWDRHLPSEVEQRARLLAGPLPIGVFNSYVSFDAHDGPARAALAETVRLVGARGVKVNVGNDPLQQRAYAEALSALLESLPPEVAVMCECHAGISIAEDPVVAATLFDAVVATERMQAIVHTHESEEHIRERFRRYGHRISHIHVNYLDHRTLSVPPLIERRDDLRRKVALLQSLGFAGSWTLEFVEGVLTDHDNPEALLAQAGRDLVVLREVLAEVLP